MDNLKTSETKKETFPIDKRCTIGFLVIILYIIYEFLEGDTDYKGAIWATIAACNLISLGLYFKLNNRLRALENSNNDHQA
jgi:hypothetical protein